MSMDPNVFLKLEKKQPLNFEDYVSLRKTEKSGDSQILKAWSKRTLELLHSYPQGLVWKSKFERTHHEAQ